MSKFEYYDGHLWNGDCLELMKDIPDGSVDMILCDLPYGTTACKWDTIVPFEPLWEQYRRVAKKDAAIVLTASQPFTTALIASNYDMFRYEWIWQKNAGSNFASVKYQPMKEHESVLVFCKTKSKYSPIMEERKGGGLDRVKNGPVKSNTGGGEVYGNIREGVSLLRNELRYPSSIQRFNRERGLHPTQKPVALFEYLIKTYTNPGEIVLDNCSGSSTTAIAARNTGRNWICIEKDPEYFEKSRQRVESHVILDL